MVIQPRGSVLEWAYKNDAVSTLVFSPQTLRRYQKKGYLKLKRTTNKGRMVYWLTKRGLAKYHADRKKKQKQRTPSSYEGYKARRRG